MPLDDSEVDVVTGRPDWPMIGEADLFEVQAAGRALKPGEIDRFRDKGGDPEALYRPHALRVDRVVFQRDGSFEYLRDLDESDGVADSVFTIVVTATYGAIDIAAWQPESNRIGLWLNRAFALGEEQILAPRLGDEPLPIWRTPMKWLRAGRQGLVVLRPGAAGFHLDCVPVLLAEDFAHGEELERILTPKKPKTKILLRKQQERTAA
jgi:hypothetical protein